MKVIRMLPLVRLMVQGMTSSFRYGSARHPCIHYGMSLAPIGVSTRQTTSPHRLHCFTMPPRVVKQQPALHLHDGSSEEAADMFRTLLVEDNTGFRQTLHDMLHEQFPQVDVREAGDSKSALSSIVENRPDV